MNAQHRRHLLVIVAAVLVTGGAWAWLVPPFEGLDESYYYQVVVERAKGHTLSQHTLFFRMAAPLLRISGERDVKYRIQINPAYGSGTNQPGEANFFLHDDAHEVTRSHVRQLYLLRALVLLLSLATIIAAYEMARCVFSPDVALLAAGLCLFLPQFSFVAAKVHSDSVAILLGTLAYWLLAARATGALGRAASWVLLALVLALAPLADREVYFLFLLIPFGLVAAERTWPRRALAAAAIVVPAVLGARFYAVGRFGDDVQAWLGPLTSSYHGRWWSDETFHYLVFEGTPKVLFGFIGWFNASILLPPWAYAIAWDAALLAIAGLIPAALSMRRSRDDANSGRHVAVLILFAGVLLNLLPILYTNVLIVRSPDGRYFFPSLAAIVIVLVIGARGLWQAVTADRRASWALLGVVAAGAVVAWATGTGAWLAAGVRANHYGNQPHLLRTLRDVAWGLAIAPLLLIAARALASPPARRDDGALFGKMTASYGLLAAAAAVNAALLLGLVRPLYVPLDDAGYRALIDREIAQGDFSRAGAVAAIAAEAYPASAPLQQRADDLRYLTGDYAHLESYFINRLRKGEPLRTRADFMALARTVRVTGWQGAKDVDAMSPATAAADLGEGPALLHVVADPVRRLDPQAADAVLTAAHAKRVSAGDRSTVFVEGVAVHPAATGGCEVAVYYRPQGRGVDRYVWLQIDAAGAASPIRLSPQPPQITPWEPGELAWDLFQVTESRPFDVSFGVQVVNNPGAPMRLGRVDHCVLID